MFVPRLQHEQLVGARRFLVDADAQGRSDHAMLAKVIFSVYYPSQRVSKDQP
jgi:hypothetical protein